MKRGYITLPGFGSGFFSNYFCVLSMMIDADQKKLIPYVDFRRTAFVEGYNPYVDENPPENSENPWDWWFEQVPIRDNDKLTLIPYTTSNFSQTKKLWKRKDLPNAKLINEKYINIKNHIIDQVDMIYENEFKDKVVLGVMARGTEMNNVHPENGNQTIDTWISKTKRVIKKHKNVDMIFLVTEDSNYLNEFENNFHNTFYLKDVFRRSNENLKYTIKYPLWPNLHKNRKNHNRILGEEVLLQALLLGKCDYLIAKQCGTSSAAILFSETLNDVYYADTWHLLNRNMKLRTRFRWIIKSLINKIGIS